jgi:nucleotide-binding universal stress UspA family protein
MNEQPAGSLVLVVGYEGSDPAQRALGAAARILGQREGWLEVVYIAPNVDRGEESSGPAADVLDSVGPEHAKLHYEVRSLLEEENKPWRLRSAGGEVAEQLIGVAQEIAEEGGSSRTVVIVIGSDHRLTFSVPTTLARRSAFPVVIVP